MYMVERITFIVYHGSLIRNRYVSIRRNWLTQVWVKSQKQNEISGASWSLSNGTNNPYCCWTNANYPMKPVGSLQTLSKKQPMPSKAWSFVVLSDCDHCSLWNGDGCSSGMASKPQPPALNTSTQSIYMGTCALKQFVMKMCRIWPNKFIETMISIIDRIMGLLTERKCDYNL